ncbi:MAG TPA: glycosyltransferase family 4 protein [Candidatus Paceibacterota bacterium]|nr:glycosyltransferase family 4 protein [Candidatus Paceibacterota bacterium]
MKINFLLPHLKISGGVRIILSYANFLGKLGHDVTILTTERSFFRRLLKKIKREPRWFGTLEAKVSYLSSWSSKYLPTADVVVGDSWRVGDFVLTLPEKFGHKVQFIQHDERLYHGEPKDVTKVYMAPTHKIVVSTWLKNIFKKDFNQEVNLLLNPIDPKLFYQASVQHATDKIRVLMLNHSYPWKGVKDGLEAYSMVKKRYPEQKLELVMFGVRGQKPKICDEYYFNPPQEKIAEIYSSCDIFLCPSWDEGFGLPSLEAMACGVVVVTYDNGGNRDYAFDGRTALVVPRRDVSRLAEKLEIAVRNSVLRQEIIANALIFVKNFPSWSEQVYKLENLLKNAINS